MVLGSFNTASGKYCCNLADLAAMTGAKTSFNTASGKYCCNKFHFLNFNLQLWSFNTASGKYCCNDIANKALRADRAGFQYRKR